MICICINWCIGLPNKGLTECIYSIFKIVLQPLNTSYVKVCIFLSTTNIIIFSAIQTDEYRRVGQMIAVCLVHGGVLPNFFSERLYAQVCGLPTPPVSLQEIYDWEFKEKLQKVGN